MALSPKEVSQLLRNSNPSIVMGAGEDRPGLVMNSFMLQPDESKIVTERLTQIFREHSAK